MRVVLVLAMLAACGDGRQPSHAECTDGEVRECYGGPPGTENVGPCKTGLEICSGGRWPGICIGDVVPLVEQCNGADDNCNGVIDDVAGVGEECTETNGCTGTRMCDGDGRVRCMAPEKNQCDLCGGPELDEIGDTCSVDGCVGAYVCSLDQSAAVCDAPVPNACDVCGGPVVDGLGEACASSDGCTGMTVCSEEGDAAVCDAPMKNECGVCGGPPVADLGTTCTGPSGCAGTLACDAAGTAAVCDCSANLCNDNGTMRPIVISAVGDLVITELMPSPLGTDADQEWFEVWVNANVDLNNVLLDRAGDSADPQPLAAFDCRPVTAGSYLVFAKKTDPEVNGGIASSLIADTFGFALVSGSAQTPGDVQLLRADGTLLDAVSYTSSRNGASLQLDPDLIDPIANDDPASFCDGTTSYGLGGMGTPGAANAKCAIVPPPGYCVDGTTVRPIVPPAAGTLVISELMPNPSGTETSREWFEIVNVGLVPFDLNGLGLDRPDDTVAPVVIDQPACAPLAPGAFALFARSADPEANDGLPPPDATFSFSLINSNGIVQVVDPGSCSGAPPVCATVYDAAQWAATSDGVSLQLPPDMLTTTANDTPANYCASSATYGTSGNTGTPRAANVCSM